MTRKPGSKRQFLKNWYSRSIIIEFSEPLGLHPDHSGKGFRSKTLLLLQVPEPCMFLSYQTIYNDAWQSIYKKVAG